MQIFITLISLLTLSGIANNLYIKNPDFLDPLHIHELKNKPFTEKVEGQKADDKKILTYNLNSEKVVGEVPEKAVENSPALIPCSEVPEKCYTKITLSPTLTPSHEPTPIIHTSPTPVPTNEPLPTGIIITPFPTEFPCPKPPCGQPVEMPDGKYIERCPMYADSNLIVMPCLHIDEAI